MAKALHGKNFAWEARHKKVCVNIVPQVLRPEQKGNLCLCAATTCHWAPIFFKKSSLVMKPRSSSMILRRNDSQCTKKHYHNGKWKKLVQSKNSKPCSLCFMMSRAQFWTNGFQKIQQWTSIIIWMFWQSCEK